VGSKTVAEAANLDVSSATVRADMVALEREGYLVQPHTSAGRIPTDRGYRYFVDHLSRGTLGDIQQGELQNFFTKVKGEVETVFEKTSSLLTRMTNYPAVVVERGGTSASIASVQLVDFGHRHLLIVAVFSDTTIVKHNLTLDRDVSAADVVEASRQLSALLLGTTLTSRVQVPARHGDIAYLVRESVAALHAVAPEVDGDQVYVAGSSRVADMWNEVDTVREILTILEQELLVVNLVEKVIAADVSVAIGSEHHVEPLANASLVVAPVVIDGEAAGAVGLLGPTRMKYREAMAAAEAVSRELARHLEERP
jgi:heat-inducible transcriptional repressor